MLLGAVDLGSNSFRVEIGRVEDGRIVTQNYWKETVRLAAGFDENGALTPEIQEKALTALARFHECLAGLPPENVRAVGTQSLRVAKNSSDFLKKAEATLGYPINTLSGHEEARLVFKGCTHTLPKSEKRRLVVDIGGASTELVIGRGFDAEKYESFHIGCVETSIRFFSEGVLSEETLNRAIVACQAELSEASVTFGEGEFDEAYGSAGTFSAVSAVCAALGWSEDGSVTLEHLERLKAELLKCRLIEKIKLPDLKPDRKEVIAGGIAILIAVFRSLGIRSMRPATGALRVGLLYELLSAAERRDTRELTVERLLGMPRLDRAQAERVAELSELIYLATDPKASEEDRRTLRWASLLHEVGTLISTSRYHRHGEYIVANADMPGFTRAEQTTLSTIILGQRGGLAKVADFIGDIRRENQVLALRLAVIFTHARKNATLPALAIIRDNDCVTISLPQAWLDTHPLSAYLLEEECAAWAKIDKPLLLKAY